MSTIKNTEFEFIHYKGTMGFVPNPLATIVNFSLMINQEDHTVNGTVRISVGTDKKTYSGKVTGTAFSTGFNDIVRILSIKGEIPSNDKFTPLLFPFEANMALKADWSGQGGFSFQSQHEAELPVKGSVSDL